MIRRRRDWTTASFEELVDEAIRRSRLRWALRHPLGGRDRVDFRDALEAAYRRVASELAERIR